MKPFKREQDDQTMTVLRQKPEVDTHNLEDDNKYNELEKEYYCLMEKYSKQKRLSLNSEATIKDLQHQARAQTELNERQSEIIEELEQEKDNIMYCLNQKVLEIEEYKQQIQRKNEQVEDQTMPEVEFANDSETEMELIILSDDDGEQESVEMEAHNDEASRPNTSDKSIAPNETSELSKPEAVGPVDDMMTNGGNHQAMKSNHVDSGHQRYRHTIRELLSIPDNEHPQELSEDTMEEALPVQVPVQAPTEKPRRVRKVFSDEEDNCLIDFIFNAEPEVTNLSECAFWRRASQTLFKVDGNDRPFQSLCNRLQLNVVEMLHRREELNTDKHRRIAKLCYEWSFKNDRQKCDKYMAMYDRARENGFVQEIIDDTSKKLRCRSFSVKEAHKVIRYMFNTYKPLPSFTGTYWRTLTSRLKNDKVTCRSVKSRKNWFYEKMIFELYKEKQLKTEEHRQIAVIAFKSGGRKWFDELTEQYDFARLPDTTDEQIAQMESLAWRKKAETVKCLNYKSPKLYSAEEDKKLIELVFNTRVTAPAERTSNAYWKRITAELNTHNNYSRSFGSCKDHFREVLLSKLHLRKELTTHEHRSVAVDVFNTWYEADMSAQHIRLYDDGRR